MTMKEGPPSELNQTMVLGVVKKKKTNVRKMKKKTKTRKRRT